MDSDYAQSAQLHADEFHAREDFHAALGTAFAQWARVEDALSHWFVATTGLSEEMARAIFYSSKNFNGRIAMLKEATKHSKLPDELSDLTKAAIKKSKQLSEFRNKIAHRVPYFDTTEDSKTYMKYILAEGTSTIIDVRDDPITAQEIYKASNNFGLLADILYSALCSMKYFDDEPSRKTKTIKECIDNISSITINAE